MTSNVLKPLALAKEETVAVVTKVLASTTSPTAGASVNVNVVPVTE